jgi:hypothetical protein
MDNELQKLLVALLDGILSVISYFTRGKNDQ